MEKPLQGAGSGCFPFKTMQHGIPRGRGRVPGNWLVAKVVVIT